MRKFYTTKDKIEVKIHAFLIENNSDVPKEWGERASYFVGGHGYAGKYRSMQVYKLFLETHDVDSNYDGRLLVLMWRQEIEPSVKDDNLKLMMMKLDPVTILADTIATEVLEEDEKLEKIFEHNIKRIKWKDLSEKFWW